jgi:comEA protein
MSDPQSHDRDWSRTPAAMVAAGILAIASFTGLIWSMTTNSKPVMHIQQDQMTSTDAPAQVLIDLNSANQTELQLLPNVGPTLAQHIIEHRTSHGPFETLEDLDRVKGIGPKTIAGLTDWVAIPSP